MKKFIRNLLKQWHYRVAVPSSLKKKFTQYTHDQRQDIGLSIEEHYLNRAFSQRKLSDNEFNIAKEAQLTYRLEYNRSRIIPWLNKLKPLEGSTILEIGCGTGIGTLAMSEQGAYVTGVDVDQGALKVANDRLKISNLNATFHNMNGNEIAKFKDTHFDFIIFYACLEHMTVEERISSLNQAWGMLSSGSLLVVLETPNRLWYYDSHTAGLPFFDWLPDDLAFYYSRFSERSVFRDNFRDINDESMLNFKRWGRGVSYHEFELSMTPIGNLNIISSLAQHEKTTLLKYGFEAVRYINTLKRIYKGLEPAFCYPYLDLVIRK